MDNGAQGVRTPIPPIQSRVLSPIELARQVEECGLQPTLLLTASRGALGPQPSKTSWPQGLLPPHSIVSTFGM